MVWTQSNTTCGRASTLEAGGPLYLGQATFEFYREVEHGRCVDGIIKKMKTGTYYQILGVSPWATERDVRRAYRQLSKQYHPDISPLNPAEALEKFKQINEAYATLTHPLKRTRYDQSIGFSRTSVIQPRSAADEIGPQYRGTRKPQRDAILSDRPLSATELFALFILGIAFVASLLLVGFISLVRG